MQILLLIMLVLVTIAVALWRNRVARELSYRQRFGLREGHKHPEFRETVRLGQVWATHNYRLRTISKRSTFEWCDDSDTILKWKERHPHGPATSAEHEEWNNLIMYQIGSYMLFAEAHGHPVDAEYIEMLWDQIESWGV